MSTPKSTLWKLVRHTAAKHEILRRYLGAWFGIMGKYNHRLIFIDGFCGPGRYEAGEIGSPLIALNTAISHYQKKHIKEVTFLFIDSDKKRCGFLQREINSMALPSDFSVMIEHSDFNNTMNNIFSHLDQKGGRLAPTFAFIDPFGFSGVPFSLVNKLLANPKTEVFINVMAQSISRFITHSDPRISNYMIDLFGTEEVLQIANSKNRIKELRSLYGRQLSTIARFVRYFEMRDNADKIIYYLFFATNNCLGHAKMKEAFWKVDQATGFHFSDKTNPNQGVLFDDDPSLYLAIDLQEHFKGQQLSVESITRYVLDETPYTESHMKKALNYLEDKNCFSSDPFKKSGNYRRKHTFPSDVIISFSPSCEAEL